jgi:hypothetical protein
VISLASGERMSVSLRIRPAEDKAVKLVTALNNSDKLKSTLRAEDGQRGHWLDIEILPIEAVGLTELPITLIGGDGSDVTIKLFLNVIDSAITVTPEALDLGQVSIQDLKGGVVKAGRVGLRTSLGSFQIKSFSTDLAFLQVEQQTIISGSNYLLKVSIIPAARMTAGTYNGVIKVVTDSPKRPLVEVPCKVTVVQ